LAEPEKFAANDRRKKIAVGMSSAGISEGISTQSLIPVSPTNPVSTVLEFWSEYSDLFSRYKTF